MAYPAHIYPDWLRRIFMYIVPALFLNYYPALYFLNKPDPFGLPAIMPFVAPLVGIGLLLARWLSGASAFGIIKAPAHSEWLMLNG